MTAVPFTQCCSMLAIDAKTLRQWLKHSNLSLHSHPTDARIKCLAIEQVQQLAALHGRSIKQDRVLPPEPASGSALLVQPEQPTEEHSERPGVSAHLGTSSPITLSDASDVVRSLSSLEATVACLQQQVAELALQLVHERELRYERRLSTLETLMQQMIEPSAGSQAPEESRGACPSDHSSARGWCPDPAELRARSRVVSLIEYAADGAYVIISPQKGELFFAPDSPEWFEWLASLSSFRFIGQLGRFSAHREVRHGQSSRRWSANLCIHNRNYTCYLGITDNLTISCLEQAAAALQSRAKSL
jgi:hypothetical protein